MRISIDLLSLYKIIEPFIIPVENLEKSESLIFKDIGFLMAYRIFLSAIKLEQSKGSEAYAFLDEKSKEIQTVIDSAMGKLCKLVQDR